MKSQDIKLNLPGFRALRKSPEVTAIVKRKAEAVQGRLGRGYGVEVKQLRNRVRAGVGPTNPKTRRDVRSDPSKLLKAREAARNA